MLKRNKAHENWIIKNMDDYQDPLTNEYDLTGIAETLADIYNLYIDDIDYEIPDDVFTLVSTVVSEQTEKLKAS